MAGSSAKLQGAAITGINVTPLVDITLVLLVVFMVTAKLIVSHRAIPLDLPKAASGGVVQEVFSVSLSADGTAYLNGALLRNDEALASAARADSASNAELRAVIQADGAVTHRRVMHVLDILKQAGVTKIGFGVVPEPASSAQGGGR